MTDPTPTKPRKKPGPRKTAHLAPITAYAALYEAADPFTRDRLSLLLPSKDGPLAQYALIAEGVALILTMTSEQGDLARAVCAAFPARKPDPLPPDWRETRTLAQ